MFPAWYDCVNSTVMLVPSFATGFVSIEKQCRAWNDVIIHAINGNKGYRQMIRLIYHIFIWIKSVHANIVFSLNAFMKSLADSCVVNHPSDSMRHISMRCCQHADTPDDCMPFRMTVTMKAIWMQFDGSMLDVFMISPLHAMALPVRAWTLTGSAIRTVPWIVISS